MTNHSRYAHRVLLACGLLAAQYSPAETLRQVIMAKGIDPAGLDSPNLDKAITSGDVLDEHDLFLTAYYLDDGSGTLQGPIHVEMLEKKRHRWLHRVLETGTLEFSGGSVCGITRSKQGFYLYTHINPSAGVTVILSPSLELQGSVFGFFLGDYADGTVVYSNSTMHFTSTHPGEVSLYDPKSKIERKIYPMKPYQVVRLGHIAKVKAAYGQVGEQWLWEHRYHADPECFTNYINDDAATSDATDSLAFVASFDNSDTLSEEGRLKLEYLSEIRDALREHPPHANLTNQDYALYCSALRQGFLRAERGHVDDKLLSAFDAYPEIRDTIKTLSSARLPDAMSCEGFLSGLDRRWTSPDTWRAVQKTANAPPPFTEVVYIYRNICKNRNLEYREILLEDVKQRFGEIPLAKLLEPETLQAIFQSHP